MEGRGSVRAHLPHDATLDAQTLVEPVVHESEFPQFAPFFAGETEVREGRGARLAPPTQTLNPKPPPAGI